MNKLFTMCKPALLAVSLGLALAGCDQLNDQINKPARDAKATGAGCRLSGRSLEDCYKRNPRAARAEVYAGWKDMNDYMAKQKLNEMAPPPDEPKPEPAAEEEGGKGGDKAGEKNADKAKSGEKPAEAAKADKPAH
ncbi:MAG: hypothetical protein U1F63_13320 [Chitinivorax sp.]